jgi:hypothetical protein
MRHLLDSDTEGIFGSHSFDYYEIKAYQEASSTCKGCVTHITSAGSSWVKVAKCKYHDAVGTGSAATGDCQYNAVDTLADA